jgi:hypothetical protein
MTAKNKFKKTIYYWFSARLCSRLAFYNEVFKMNQAMFNELEDAKQFAKTVKELLCIKEPVMINNKLTYVVVYK